MLRGLPEYSKHSRLDAVKIFDIIVAQRPELIDDDFQDMLKLATTFDDDRDVRREAGSTLDFAKRRLAADDDSPNDQLGRMTRMIARLNPRFDFG